MRDVLDSDEESDDDHDIGKARGAKKQNVVVCLRVRPSRNPPESEIYHLSASEAKVKFAKDHPVFVKRGAMTARATSGSGAGAGGAGGLAGGEIGKDDEYEFRFDALHLSPHPTSDLYTSKVKPVVLAAMKGYNATVFAYGQTASGKTHTMMGTPDEPGIIPLSISELFLYIQSLASLSLTSSSGTSVPDPPSKRAFVLQVSFLEIYNEAIRDLLVVTPSRLELQGEGGEVKGLSKWPVGGVEEVLELLKEGEERRRTGGTDWNERSSRSHCVFMVTIESLGPNGIARTSRLNLIDLAGSESATGQEERRREGAFINKSLLTLGTVIGKLSEGGSHGHIPYRDSKLTRLLQPALSGNSRVTVICTMSPDPEQATESLSTLKFARRAKMVVTKAERGVLVTDQMMLRKYQIEVAKLQAQIQAKELGIEHDLAREHEAALMAKYDELHSRNKETEEALAAKDEELAKLRATLEHTKSFILTGSSLEANTRRRESGQFITSRSASSLLGSPVKSYSASGLGFGSSPARRGAEGIRISSATPVPSLRIGTLEKELQLEVQLEASEKKLAAVSLADASKASEIESLRADINQLQQRLSAAQNETEVSTNEITSLQNQLQQLEQQSREIEDQAAESAHVKDAVANNLASKLEATQEELSLAKEHGASVASAQLAALQEQLVACQARVEDLLARLAARDQSFQEVEDMLEEKGKRLAEAELRIRSLEKRLAVAKAGDADKIKDLDRELTFLKKELASLTLAKSSGIQSANAKTDAVRLELEAAQHALAESDRRLRQLEDLDVSRQRALQVELAQHGESLASAQARSVVLEETNATYLARISSMERTIEHYEQMEAIRNSFAASQRMGPEALKAKMAAMKAGQLLRTPTATPTSGVFSRSNSLASSMSLDIVLELENANAKLVARVDQLERERLDASTSSAHSAVSLERVQEDNSDLSELLRVRTDELTVTKASEEHWRQKYLELERRLNPAKLSSESDSSRPKLLENVAPTFEVPRRSHSSTSSATSSATPIRLPHRGRHMPSLSSPNFTFAQMPPPLPASPHNVDKERRLRRVTIAKDMEALSQAKKVATTKEALDSPTSTPKSARTDPFRD